LNHETATKLLGQRPSVARLCGGAYLQSPLWISEHVLVVPLAPLGFDTALAHTRDYASQFLGASISEPQVEENRCTHAETHPALTVVYFPKISGSPMELEALARPHLERAEQLIAWATGDPLVEFAYVTATNADTFFRLVPWQAARRVRLGFGNTGNDFEQRVWRLRQAADDDPRFAFAMAMFADAAHERNPLFKVCRFFAVLECLAYALKSEEMGSRSAIRRMLGLQPGPSSVVNFGTEPIRYDRIEIAGRIRNHYLHGNPYEGRDLNAEARQVLALIERHPDEIACALQTDCELALERWASDASPARDAARIRAARKL
jgi:hypothetical protein